MKGFSKKLLAILCTVALLSGVALSLAIPTWSQTINWNYSAENKSFSISNPTTVTYEDIVGETTKTETYTVTNDGNMPITVNAVAVATGAVASWDKVSANLAVGASETFTLTLIISGAGSCTVSFSLV